MSLPSAKLRRALRFADHGDDGFTLIELLVVIIIIGILAAIAIPVFLNQRNKGYDAAAKSDLNAMSTAEETYLTDYNIYTSNVASLTSEGFNKSSNVDGWAATPATNQTFTATDCSASGTKWQYSSATGLVSKLGACTY